MKEFLALIMEEVAVRRNKAFNKYKNSESIYYLGEQNGLSDLFDYLLKLKEQIKD